MATVVRCQPMTVTAHRISIRRPYETRGSSLSGILFGSPELTRLPWSRDIQRDILYASKLVALPMKRGNHERCRQRLHGPKSLEICMTYGRKLSTSPLDLPRGFRPLCPRALRKINKFWKVRDWREIAMTNRFGGSGSFWVSTRPYSRE